MDANTLLIVSEGSLPLWAEMSMESSQAKQANIFVQVDGIDNVVATWPGPKTAGAVEDLYSERIWMLDNGFIYNDLAGGLEHFLFSVYWE